MWMEVGRLKGYKELSLLHVEPSGDAKTVKMIFDILMRKNMEPSEFSQQIAELEGVTEVVLVASKHDVDY